MNRHTLQHTLSASVLKTTLGFTGQSLDEVHHSVVQESYWNHGKLFGERLINFQFSNTWQSICFASSCWVFYPQPRKDTISSLNKPSLIYLCYPGVNTSFAVQVHEKNTLYPAKVVQPSATKALWDFYFGCAWENVKGTLRSPTSILPLLSPTLTETVPKLEWKAHFASSFKQQSTQKPFKVSSQSQSSILWKGNMLWTLHGPVWLRV